MDRRESDTLLQHPLLEACGVRHSFGLRDMEVPARVFRPKQEHGAAVASFDEEYEMVPFRADAVVSRVADVAVGVATADCVPVLAASREGDAVAAIHAGWRGLAAGVIEAAIAALRDQLEDGAEVVAVVGPHIGVCCYEVDGPVLEALAPRFDAALRDGLVATRSGHARIDLGALAAAALVVAGVSAPDTGFVRDACTHCDAERFHSYRRDGDESGRLIHYIAASGAPRQPLQQG